MKRGNRFNGNTAVVAQRRRHTDARYAAGAYTETWLKVPKTLEWAVQPGQRFVAKVVNEGMLFAPEEKSLAEWHAPAGREANARAGGGLHLEPLDRTEARGQ